MHTAHFRQSFSEYEYPLQSLLIKAFEAFDGLILLTSTQWCCLSLAEPAVMRYPPYSLFHPGGQVSFAGTVSTVLCLIAKQTEQRTSLIERVVALSSSAVVDMFS